MSTTAENAVSREFAMGLGVTCLWLGEYAGMKVTSDSLLSYLVAKLGLTVALTACYSISLVVLLLGLSLSQRRLAAGLYWRSALCMIGVFAFLIGAREWLK